MAREAARVAAREAAARAVERAAATVVGAMVEVEKAVGMEAAETAAGGWAEETVGEEKEAG